jgi:hypothetical protein
MLKVRHSILMAKLLLGLCAGFSYAQSVPFVGCSSMSVPRQLPLMVTLKDGNVLVAGGFNASASLASAEIYIPSNGTWRATTAMHYPRAYSSITLLQDGRVLVAGGGGAEASASAEVYDPLTETWTLTGPLTAPRFYQKAVLLQDGRVLVSGGCFTSYLSSAEIYDPTTGTWTLTASMSIPRVLHTMVCLQDGRVLVAGGHIGGTSFSSTELYDPASDQWTSASPMPVTRGSHSMILLTDGRVLVCGGVATGYSFLARAEIYDPETDQWILTGSMTAQREWHTLTLLADGRVLASGGRSSIGPSIATAEIYNPQTEQWLAISPMTSARRVHAATLLSDGRVFIAGGISGYDSGDLVSAECYGLEDGGSIQHGSGLILWNRLGSTNEVNNSEIGPSGTLNAGRFVDGPFGKGIELNMQEQMGVTFPPQIVPAPDGCIEFWAKLSGFPEAIRQPGGAWPILVGTSVLNFGIAFCSNNGAASGGIVQGVPGLGTSGTGLYGYWTYASALKTNTVSDWHHYALVWSGAGIPGVDNGQRRVISYIDGRMNTGHWIGTTGTQFTGLTNVIFGLLAHQGVPTGSVAYDNIKIWNFAKTNFSDRLDEDAGDHRRFLSIVEARGEAVPGNGVQMYTYGASVNASVPETVTDGGVRYICTGATVDGNQFTLDGPATVAMMLTNNATLTWQWRTEYLLQVTTNGNGSVNDATGWHVAGNNLQLTPVPAVGWTFDDWAGETDGCVMEGSVLNVAMTQPRTISASFALATALLTFNPQGGAVTPSTKSVTFDNTYGELPMAERADYLFKGWWTGVNGQGTQILPSSVIAIAGNHMLYANWEKIPLLCKPGDYTLLTKLGFYEGFLSDEGDFDGTPTLEMRGTVRLLVSVSRLHFITLSAKVSVQGRSLVFKNPPWFFIGQGGVIEVVMTAAGGEILDLSVGQTRFWGTLSGGSLGGEVLVVDGMRNRFADRQDAEAQAILNTFRGYYTLALPAYGALSLGEAEAAPEGSGYLTITVGNQGHVSIGGVLADGTKFSKSSSLILFDGCGPEACVPLFVPLYAQKGWMSGLLWFDPVKRTIVTERDLGWFLRWEKPGSGADGFSALLDACGGFYSTLDALSSYYRFSAGTNEVPYYRNGVAVNVQPSFPSGISVAADNRRLVITQGIAPRLADGAYDYAASENSSLATLSFREATGVFSGSFKLYYDYTEHERLYHRAVTVQYSGVLVPRRSEVFDDLPIGQGFYLVPDNNPALDPLRLKRSYPIELDAGR